ncbi:unnamed protein product [Umbelopsis sp. WA50703]
MDDYRDIRDRERDRERDRAMMMRDDRYPPRGRERDDRYMGYYRDDIGPPPPHGFSGPPPPIRREGGNIERPKPDSRAATPTGARDDIGRLGPPGPPDGYRSPRYMDWRDRNRERDRDRDRRYREDERRRDLDRRDRSRDGYPRYEHPLPPHPPYPGDSYRDRERDREFDDRDYYRPPRPGSPPDYDRFRGRPPRPDRPPNWGPPSGPSGYGPPRRDSSRGRDMEDVRSPRGASAAIVHPPRPREREDTFGDRRRDTFPPPPKAPYDPNLPPRKRSSTPPLSKWDSDLNKRDTAAKPKDDSIAEKSVEQDSKELESKKMSEDVPSETVEEAPMTEEKKETEPALPVLEFARPERLDEPQSRSEADAHTSKPVEVSNVEQITTPENEDKVGVKPEPVTEDIRKLSELSEHIVEELPSSSIDQTSESEQVAITDMFERPKTPMNGDAMEVEPVETKAEEEPNVSLSKHMESVAESLTNAAENEELTEQGIVERIDQIENDISVYEELLEKRVASKNKASTSDKVLHASEAAAMMRNAVQAEEEVFVDVLNDVASRPRELSTDEAGAEQQDKPVIVVYDAPPEPSPAARKSLRAQIEQYHDEEDDTALYKKLYEENRKLAKANSHLVGGWQGKPDSEDDWSDEENWSKPIFTTVESYPFYQSNLESFAKMRNRFVTHVAGRRRKLKAKEARLKRRYKSLHDQWKAKNMELDRVRDQERRASDRGYKGSSYRKRTEDENEGPIDGIDFDSPFDALRFGPEGPSTPYGAPHRQGPWASDTVRSEAELLEIIQSLESADMRNPELRAAKTTANIPAMILDPKERAKTFDDRSGLVEDPVVYYHTGKDTGDVWTKQETSTFLESYMIYPKQFGKIASAIGTKNACQSVLLYYRMKKTIDFKGLVAASLKGKRSRSGKKKDRLAAAVRAATSGATRGAGRGGKNKGSALLADIGLAQDSRKAKEKERKNKELRELEEAGGYWDKLGDRRRTRTREKPPRTPTDYMSESQAIDKRRGVGKRKGKAAKGVADEESSPRRSKADEEEDEDDDSYETPKDVTTAKWTATERDAAVEAFKIHGRNFMQVSEIVGTKTEDQCRNLYHNYKRKFGPNAFNEESARSTMAADEEDAAAALVGMFSMGGISPQGEVDSGASTPRKPGRRPRTASVNPTFDDVAESDPDYMAAKGKKGPKQVSTPDQNAGKRPAYSSYWSVSEKSDFVRYLEMYGRDWERLADAMKSKTATQVRNFFQNNLEKMQLDKVIMRFDRRQQPAAKQPPMHPMPASEQPPSHDSPYPSMPQYGYPPGMPSQVSGPPPPSHYGGPRQGYFPPEGHQPPTMPSASPPQAYASYQPYRMHSPPRSAFVRSYPNQPPPPPVAPPIAKEESTTVTKVADLLNNDDSTDTSQAGNWESWFN